MTHFDKLRIKRILEDQGCIRVSIFAPMEQVTSRAKMNAIRFKNLISRVNDQLRAIGLDVRPVRSIKAQLLAGTRQ